MGRVSGVVRKFDPTIGVAIKRTVATREWYGTYRRLTQRVGLCCSTCKTKRKPRNTNNETTMHMSKTPNATHQRPEQYQQHTTTRTQLRNSYLP